MVQHPFRLPAFAEIEGPRAGQQFITDDAKAIEIAAAVHGMQRAGGVFRRHIGQRAARSGQQTLRPLPISAGRKAESAEAATCLREKNISRFDIAVDQVAFVHLAQRRTDAQRQFDPLIDR